MHFTDRGRQGTDVRFNRFQILEWDYRGVFGSRVTDAALLIDVEPQRDSALKLTVVVHDDGTPKRRTVAAPELVRIPVDGTVHRVNMTLRSGDTVVCEGRFDAWNEAAMQALDGRFHRSSSAPVFEDPPPPSAVAEFVLGFMTDKRLASMVARDLAELDAARVAHAAKASILLIGSVLETVLLDVLSRNEGEMRRRFPKTWPDRVSLGQLLEAAGSLPVALGDGSVVSLLPPLTGKKGTVVTDHRDLIHPRAEVRGQAPVDTHTADTMHGILREVLRDLNRAHEDGVFEAYAAADVDGTGR
jgi:hypothetical protein